MKNNESKPVGEIEAGASRHSTPLPCSNESYIVDDRGKFARIYHDRYSTKPIDVNVDKKPLPFVLISVPEITLTAEDIDLFIEALEIAKEKALNLQAQSPK